MKKITLLLSLLSLTMTSVFASPKPARCPSVSAIKNVPFDGMLGNKENGYYFYIRDNTFATHEHWSFILLVAADDKADAVKEAQYAIDHFQFDGVSSEGENKWMCHSSKFDPQTKEFHIIAALTPPEPIDESNLRHLLSRQGVVRY